MDSAADGQWMDNHAAKRTLRMDKKMDNSR